MYCMRQTAQTNHEFYRACLKCRGGPVLQRLRSSTVRTHKHSAVSHVFRHCHVVSHTL